MGGKLYGFSIILVMLERLMDRETGERPTLEKKGKRNSWVRQLHSWTGEAGLAF